MARQADVQGKKEISKLLLRGIDSLNLGITITTFDGKILFTNAAEARMHGFEVKDLLGKDARIFAPRDLWKGITPDQAKEISSWSRESVNIRKDGSVFPVQIVSDVIMDAEGNPEAVITICEDISERRISVGAFYDSLTGLPNRALFMDRLGRSVKRTKRRTDCLFAVIYLDLDRFKAINDVVGFEMADRLLISCSRRIESCLRFGDTVAHLGGDEFAILLEDVRSVNDAVFVADRIQQHLGLPFHIHDEDLYVSASMGIAQGAGGYDRPEDIIRDADTAMYRAKALGRGRQEVFDKSMQTRAMALLPLEMSLRRAIEQQELLVQYQPIHSLESGTLLGCEATIRWIHPERGAVDSGEFLPIAEEAGLAGGINDWLLKTASAQAKQWQQHCPNLILFVQISLSELLSRDWLERLPEILKGPALAPAFLELQITEDQYAGKLDKIGSALNEVQKMGLNISICNYGTGQSSLESLLRFKVNTLKFDRAFLHDMLEDTQHGSVAVATIALAHSMKIRVIADGVENDEQLSFLRWHHCDAAQGKIFGLPMTAEDFSKKFIEK